MFYTPDRFSGYFDRENTMACAKYIDINEDYNVKASAAYSANYTDAISNIYTEIRRFQNRYGYFRNQSISSEYQQVHRVLYKLLLTINYKWSQYFYNKLLKTFNT